MHHAHLLAPRPCTQGRGVGVRGSVNLQESKTLTPDPSPLSTRRLLKKGSDPFPEVR